MPKNSADYSASNTGCERHVISVKNFAGALDRGSLWEDLLGAIYSRLSRWKSIESLKALRPRSSELAVCLGYRRRA